jgi:hypothetical protein
MSLWWFSRMAGREVANAWVRSRKSKKKLKKSLELKRDLAEIKFRQMEELQKSLDEIKAKHKKTEDIASDCRNTILEIEKKVRMGIMSNEEAKIKIREAKEHALRLQGF